MTLFNFVESDGLTMSIMQSRQNLDLVYPYYEKLRETHSPTASRKIALDYYNLSEADFTDLDLAELTV